MNSKLPTVTIKTENGPVIINESDYDPDQHELMDGEEPVVEPEEPVKEPEKTKEPSELTPPVDAPKMLVSKEGRKHFVVGEDGKKIEAEGIDAKGYGSEADAWAAIMALNTA